MNERASRHTTHHTQTIPSATNDSFGAVGADFFYSFLSISELAGQMECLCAAAKWNSMPKATQIHTPTHTQIV